MKLPAVVILLIAHLQPAPAQDFKGIYVGSLISKSNVMTVKTKGNVVSGILFMSADDKFDFIANIEGRELVGTLNYPPGNWRLNGEIISSDSLSITISSGDETKRADFFKLSSNPNKDVSKIMESLARDQRMIGIWKHGTSLNVDGTPKPIDERFIGMTYEFTRDGYVNVRIPYLSATLKDFDKIVPPQQGTWSTTSDSKLARTYSVPRMGTKTSTVKYEIRSDTLIIETTGGKEFWVKKGKKAK